MLEEESVIKGRDFSNTERNFTNTIEQGGNERGRRPPMPKQGFNPDFANYQPPLVPGNYPNVMMPTNPMGQAYGYPPTQYPPPPPTGGYNMPPPPPYGYYPPPIVPQYDQSKKQQVEKEKQS